ncbi:MAG: hypothetical protein Q4P15_01650 [Propionibacteriaceae bacterium]|nr:hypothetical protein [Propionibacteriaceae bacterium]
MGDEDYRQVNRANWNDRARLHPQSPGYDLDRFRRDPSVLSDVVQFDVPRLGDVSGLEVVHLQCHIGTDTLSLSRLGAQVTGLDFSSVAIDSARALAWLKEGRERLPLSYTPQTTKQATQGDTA